MKFPQVKGKTLEEVDFSTDTEDHSITLVFQDKTALISLRSHVTPNSSTSLSS